MTTTDNQSTIDDSTLSTPEHLVLPSIDDPTPGCAVLEDSAPPAGAPTTEVGTEPGVIDVDAPIIAVEEQHALPAEVGTTVAQGSEVRRSARGTDGKRDSIWTRHHAICSMGVLCDLILGGYDAARLETHTPGSICRGDIAPQLASLCPWLVNVRNLNFEGSRDLEKFGFDRCFERWVYSRVDYFYRYADSSEHPAKRKKANLSTVYKDFYDAFANDITRGAMITEERAREFWLSVADRVPFLAPAAPGAGVAAPTQGPPIHSKYFMDHALAVVRERYGPAGEVAGVPDGALADVL